jgi:2-haloacid dehalogenase
VLPGLERLRGAGFRLVTLTNSAPDPQVNPIERSGIGRMVERQFSVDPLRRFKPALEVYQQVSDALALPPQAFCMVAAHHWDLIGAQALGWVGALVTRPGQAAVPGLPAPDLAAPDVDQLATAIIRRWR